jgi:CRISPR-associated protein Csb3
VEVLAYFEPQRFILTVHESGCSLAALLSEFAGVGCHQLDPGDRTASALYLPGPFNLRLDWWCRSKEDGPELGSAGQLKTWAGQQPGPVIFRLMKQAAGNAASMESPLDYSEAIFDSKDGKTKKKTISPFYFDCRREGTSLDLGFSPDEQNMSVGAYPVVESLALVGLQRFRPYTDEGTRPRSFVYNAWAESLPATVAAVTVCGAVDARSRGRFRFTRPSRGGEYVTMFSRATRERNKNVGTA